MPTLFSRSELYALGLVQASWIVGLPETGLLPEDAEERARMSREGIGRLQRRDFVRLTQTDSGQVEVLAGENLALLCEALFKPRRVLLVSRATPAPAASSQTRYFHLSERALVEQQILGDDMHAVRLVSPESLEAWMQAMLPGDGGGAPTVIYTTEAAFESAIRAMLTAKPDAAVHLIRESARAQQDAALHAWRKSLDALRYVAVLSLLEIKPASDGAGGRNGELTKVTLIATPTHNWIALSAPTGATTLTTVTAQQWRDTLGFAARAFLQKT